MSDYTVTASALDLRAGPGTGYSILERLAHGAVVTEKTAPDAQGWMAVVTVKSGRSGWVADRYLAPVVHHANAGQTSPHQATPAGVSDCSTDDGLVFDLSHFNGRVDLAEAYTAGQRGVIHKASEGAGYVDPMYAATRTQAAAAGLLWGAYHFGIGGDPVAQATHFLATAKPDGNTLLVLDLESNPDGSSMSMDEAGQFVSNVQQKTGIWPGLYGGSYVREQMGEHADTALGQCWFWLAEYGPTAHVPANWKDWTLWQYTDGHVDSPHSISGVGDCDRNRFNGDEQQLLAFWKSRGAGEL